MVHDPSFSASASWFFFPSLHLVVVTFFFPCCRNLDDWPPSPRGTTFFEVYRADRKRILPLVSDLHPLLFSFLLVVLAFQTNNVDFFPAPGPRGLQPGRLGFREFLSPLLGQKYPDFLPPFSRKVSPPSSVRKQEMKASSPSRPAGLFPLFSAESSELLFLSRGGPPHSLGKVFPLLNRDGGSSGCYYSTGLVSVLSRSSASPPFPFLRAPPSKVAFFPFLAKPLLGSRGKIRTPTAPYKS